jgi:hypothetical protein
MERMVAVPPSFAVSASMVTNGVVAPGLAIAAESGDA